MSSRPFLSLRPARHAAAALLASFGLLLAATPAQAQAQAKNGEPPGQARKQGAPGHSAKAGKSGQAPQGERSPREVRINAFFTLEDRDAARSFYQQRYAQTRRCPPGLAKKNNGCLPPGQAKKYTVGQRLPRDVVLYPVPPGVLIHLPPVPVGHEYVRVAADILLIAVGTQIVVDAMTDLMR